MTDIQSTIDEIRAEIRVDLHGCGFASIRGTARLADVNERSIRKHLSSADKKPSKVAQMLLEHGFDMRTFAEAGVPDVAVSLFVKYYAWMAGKYCTDRAKQFDMAFAGVGTRVWMQQVAGWQPPIDRKLTTEEIAEICLLPGGRDWKKRFGDPYYNEMSKLTNLQQIGHKRPALWGKLTDEWVYQMLPTGVREGVRLARLEHDGWNKLHQFLSDDGLAVFERHMETLMILMKAADSVNGVRRSLKNMARSEYQHRLFDDCRKDGQLTISRQLRLLNAELNSENESA